MAQSGSFWAAAAAVSPGSHYRLRVDWQTQPDTAAGETVVKCDFYLEQDATWSVERLAGAGHSCRIDGVKSAWTSPALSNSGGVTTYLNSVSRAVVHTEAREVEVSVTFYFGCTISGEYLYAITASDTLTLEPLAQGGVPVVQGALTLGQEALLTVRSQLGGLTHTLYCLLGEQKYLLGEGEQVLWTPPPELAYDITDADRREGSLLCESRQEGTLFSTASVPVTLLVPESMTPTAALTLTDAAGALECFGVCAGNVSALQVALTGEGAFGSTVVSREAVFRERTYSGDFSTGTLTDTGDFPLTVYVTDSRGRSASAEYTVTVAPYTPPSLTLSASRCTQEGAADDTGEYAHITVSGHVADVAGANTARLLLTLGEDTHTLEAAVGDFTAEVILPAASVRAWSLEATLSDAILSARSTMTLSIGFATMDFFSGGRGIAFGTTATREGFTCAMATDMAGHALTGLPAPEGDSDAATKAYVDSVRSAARVLSVAADTAVEVSLSEGELLQLSFLAGTLTAGDIYIKANGAAPHAAAYTYTGTLNQYSGGILTYGGSAYYASFSGFVQLLGGRLHLWGMGLRGNGSGMGWTHMTWTGEELSGDLRTLTLTAPGTLALKKL